jgi:hypothetical protein
MSDLVLTKEDTTPTPPAGTVSIYAKSDGIFYTKTEGGVETSLKGDKGDQGETGSIETAYVDSVQASPFTTFDVDVTGKCTDARQCGWHVLDAANDYETMICSIKRMSATSVRVTFPISQAAGTYRVAR